MHNLLRGVSFKHMVPENEYNIQWLANGTSRVGFSCDNDARHVCVGRECEFSRTETDLEKLTARLMQVVDETLQPKSVSVWLSKGNEPGTGRKP